MAIAMALAVTACSGSKQDVKPEELMARKDAPRVVILTTFDSDDSVLRALAAGAVGRWWPKSAHSIPNTASSCASRRI